MHYKKGLPNMAGNAEKLYADQRANERFEINKSVVMHVASKAWPVEMKNISVSGFGIFLEANKDFNKIVSPDAIIDIEWGDKERLSAKVVWINANKAGIMLIEALCHDHPLLMEAQSFIVPE